MLNAVQIEKARNILTNEVNSYLNAGATKISTHKAMWRKYGIHWTGVDNFIKKNEIGFHILQKYAQKILEYKE